MYIQLCQDEGTHRGYVHLKKALTFIFKSTVTVIYMHLTVSHNFNFICFIFDLQNDLFVY